MNCEIIENVKKNLAKGLKWIDELAIKKNIEIWKTIEEFPNYEVSSKGYVKNVVTGRILKPVSVKGYHRIDLYLNGSRQKHLIHRLVANAFITNSDLKPCVDHINNNRTDNNVNNLRFATYKENCHNVSLLSRNTSGVKGCRWNKRDKKWVAQIMINGKVKHIGYYNTLAEATEARQLKAKELFGEYMNDCEK